MVVDAGDEVLLVILGQCWSVRLLHFAAARGCRSRLRLGRGPGSFLDLDYLFCAEDVQHPGQGTLRAQQHQAAAALPQLLGGKQEHPDAGRIREVQSAHVDGQRRRAPRSPCCPCCTTCCGRSELAAVSGPRRG
jgi:hypothetical protein